MIEERRVERKRDDRRGEMSGERIDDRGKKSGEKER